MGRQPPPHCEGHRLLTILMSLAAAGRQALVHSVGKVKHPTLNLPGPG